MDRPIIMIVDDMAFELDVCTTYLEDKYEVYTATSAQNMLKLLENITPDVMLLDVMMPGINGYEAARMLKAEKRYCEIPIIMISGLSDVESEVEGFAVGASDYLYKPIRKEHLIHRIKVQLMLRQHQIETKAIHSELIAISKNKKESEVI